MNFPLWTAPFDTPIRPRIPNPVTPWVQHTALLRASERGERGFAKLFIHCFYLASLAALRAAAAG